MKKQTMSLMAVLAATLLVLSVTVACESRQEHIEEQAAEMPTPSDNESGQPISENGMAGLAVRTAEEMGVAENEGESEDDGQPATGAGDEQHGDMDSVLEEGEYDPNDVVRQPGAEVGDIAQCPVGAEVFTVTEDSTYVDTDDGRVYFCCPNCIRRFQRDPQRYLDTQDVAADEE